MKKKILFVGMMLATSFVSSSAFADQPDSNRFGKICILKERHDPIKEIDEVIPDFEKIPPASTEYCLQRFNLSQDLSKIKGKFLESLHQISSSVDVLCKGLQCDGEILRHIKSWIEAKTQELKQPPAST